MPPFFKINYNQSLVPNFQQNLKKQAKGKILKKQAKKNTFLRLQVKKILKKNKPKKNLFKTKNFFGKLLTKKLRFFG